MDINEFIKNFAEQFNIDDDDDFDASVFTAETKYKEIENYSSMIALSVIAMIDEVYDIQIKGEDIVGTQTIAQLFERVKAAQAN